MSNVGQILITGCYRSGTSYLTQLLDNHPKISAEMHLTNFMSYYWGKFDDISKFKNYSKLVTEAELNIKKRWDRPLDAKHIIIQLRDEPEVTYDLIYNLIMEDLTVKSEHEYWAEKSQLVWRQIPEFIRNFEKGKSILVLRDPRSVVASFKKHTYHPEPAYLSSIFNMLDLFQRAITYKKILPRSSFFIVKYEQIVKNRQKTLSDLIEFLQLSAENYYINEHEWKDTKGNDWKNNTAFGSDNFDSGKAVDRWKYNLEDWEVALTQSILSDYMIEFGYKPHNSVQLYDQQLVNLRTDVEFNELYEDWKYEEKGIQKFPANPLKEENWTENNES
jgi:hypothetical protein